MAPGAQLTRVGVYERSLPVSAERVWENVRDWEHLPWLHASSFSSIECLAEVETDIVDLEVGSFIGLAFGCVGEDRAVFDDDGDSDWAPSSGSS